MAGGRDKTPDKVLEKEERAEGVRALKDEERTDNKQHIDDADRIHFASIAMAMEKAVGAKPILELHKDMNSEEQRAIELLYEAGSGQEIQSGDYLFADQRSALLNQSLRTLQPVLSMGLAPEFLEGRSTYQRLANRVTGLRKTLSRAACGQVVINQRHEPKENSDGGDENEDDGRKDDDETDGKSDGSRKEPSLHPGAARDERAVDGQNSPRIGGPAAGAEPPHSAADRKTGKGAPAKGRQPK